jgi:hypothetical protein
MSKRKSQRSTRTRGASTPVPGRRYLRKVDLMARYGWKVAISVDRAWKEYHTLPPPTIYRTRFPLWDEAILDAHDATLANSPRETA